MKKLSVLVFTVIIAAGLYSCHVTGITGSRNVIIENRTFTSPFQSIDVSEGIEVEISRADSIAVSVEADDNIISLLVTEVRDGVLYIYFDDFVGRVKSKKVFVQMPLIESIETSSGASVKGLSSFQSASIDMEASSGSEIEMEVMADHANCTLSSGSRIHIYGTSLTLKGNASSGSDLDAAGLKVNLADVNASSGSEISLYVTEELKADASSGAEIYYYGNPPIREISKSSGGGVYSK